MVFLTRTTRNERMPLFEDLRTFFDRDPFFGAGLEDGRAQVRETEAGLSIEVEVPGVAPDAVEVTVEDGVLVIQAAREVEVPDGHRAHRLERGSFRLSRRFRLGSKFDAEGVDARVAHGLLTIDVPKVQSSRRAIPVRAE